MSENNNNDLNEVFEEEMDDADVITVPIDETLSNSGEAADAAAVGAALALKADKDELPATIKVNGQQADNQGLILINGTHIPVNGSTQKTLAEAVSEVSGMTAETIPMSEETGAATIAAEIEDIKEDVSDLQEAIDGMEEKTADNIPMETGSTTTVKNAIETLDRKAVKSVNRKLPDAAGDVDLSVVPLAENLQSDKLQSIEGEFIIRTTGGNGAVADGKAYPQHIYGNCQHNGYVAEVLNLTVIPITRTEPDEPITATIDRDTFVAAVDESSTINLYYTTEWSEDPEDYGVTVTGDPVAGDQITIVYVKEQRGTILVADPDRLVGTGWNLFNANDGYARVVKYSDVYGYKIGGTYTSIAFSATLTGDRTSLLPNANGLFNVPSDGYVFVTGGNGTDTYILATWSDWTEGPSTGYWEAYRESGIDLSSVVETYFPYGMLKIGTVRDEIDLVAKRSISRIERMVYSEENRADAAATGRDYDFDESNIYIVREEYVQNAITIGGEYSVSEHGMEWFTETELPLDTEILYGKNLRDKLERDVLTISPQNLVAEEQAQVRRNIGVMDPPLNGNGTAAQLLKTNGDGTTEWTTQGTPTDAQVGTAVSAWLTAHPEATTTVQDGAISRAKLNDDLKAKTDAVPDLKSALNFDRDAVEKITGNTVYNICESGYIATNGETVNISSVVSSQYYVHGVFDCNAGDEIYIEAATGGETPRVCCFVDNNGNSLYATPASPNTKTNLRLTAPTGTKKVVFNCSSSSAISIYKNKLIKNALAESDHILGIEKIIDYTPGGYINTGTPSIGDTVTITPVSISGVGYAIVPCVHNDIFNIKGDSGDSLRLWAFVDSTYHLLSKADANAKEAINIVAPQNSAYVITNNALTIDHYAYKGISKTGYINDQISTIEKKINSGMYLNLSYLATNNGQYIDTDGTVKSSGALSYSDYISIPAGATHILCSNSYMFAGSKYYMICPCAFYNSGKNLIETAEHKTTDFAVNKIPGNAKYVRINRPNISNNSVSVVDNYFMFISLSENKVYKVSKTDSDADFDSVTACFLALKDDDSPKTIEIWDGDYDIYQEYKDCNVPVYTGTNPAMEFVPYCVFIPKNTHVIGKGIVRLIWMPTKEDNPEITWMQCYAVSPVNVLGSMTLENVEIHCKNGRYCIHNDTIGLAGYAGSSQKYINVRCYKYENEVDTTTTPGESHIYGTNETTGYGINVDSLQYYDNCIFENQAGGRAIQGHTNLRYNGVLIQQQQSGEMVFNQCIFETNGQQCIQMQNSETEQHQHVRVRYNDCYFNKYVDVDNQGKYNAYDILFYDCGNVTLSIDQTGNAYAPKAIRTELTITD